MKFALGMPALILYPPIMSPWEPQAGRAEILRIAQTADASGWDWLTVSEHIVMPKEMGEVMGARFPEALTAAAVLLGATQRVKVLTYVLVLPYRHAVTLAKEVATVDFLSGGRIILGAGIGHLQREFEILNAPYAERGALADEQIQAMKALWTQPDPQFHGRHVRFDNLLFEPKPVQQPHPPVLIGGNSKPAMRRAARLGDGWLPWLVTREQLPECLAYIRRQPEFDARRPFEVVMPLAQLSIEDYSHRQLGETRFLVGRDEILREVEALRSAGVTVTQVVPPRTENSEQLLEWIGWFAREIISACRN